MARPKVIVQLYPMMPAGDRAERERRRPLGRDGELYHRVLHDWIEIARAADEMGVWGVSTIEHHLHSEGYEVGPNPGVINAWWASQLKHARVGAIGYVMATQDPIRVAEETAILDHIAKGRYFVGLARGYQSRWTNILGQGSGAVATVSDASREDISNRLMFEERTRMLIECWTRDAVEIRGDYYQIPFPFETGVRGYPAWESARDAGAIGEIAPDGSVRKVSVVPPPYQRPYPPVFVAVSASAESIVFCARHGFRPTYFANLDRVVEFSRLYVEEAAKAGRKVAHGERQNIVRWIHVTNTAQEYDDKILEYDLDIYKHFYSAFFPQLVRDESLSWLERVKQGGIYMGGPLSTLQLEWEQTYARLPSEYITLIWHYAQCPKEVVLDELQTFMTKVLPNLDAPDSHDRA